jgi:hypothetical protein
MLLEKEKKKEKKRLLGFLIDSEKEVFLST